jgi:hypothetical protein
MTSRTHHEPCFLYGLIDPRTATVFYVGISNNPQRRFDQHRTDRASPACDRFNEIEAAGLRPQLKVLWGMCGRQRTRDLETRVIQEFPALTNNLARIANRAAKQAELSKGLTK